MGRKAHGAAPGVGRLLLTPDEPAITMNVMTLFSMQECERGPVLIGGGLLLMLLAQIGSGFPVVTPIALVGWGAVDGLWVFLGF